MGCSNGQARREVIAVLDEISEYRAQGYTILDTHIALKGKGSISCQKTAFYKWVRHFETCDPETFPSRTTHSTLLDVEPKSPKRSEEVSESSATATSKIVKPQLPTFDALRFYRAGTEANQHLETVKKAWGTEWLSHV